MAAVISIISRHDLRNEVYHRYQPSKTKLALYKPFTVMQLSLSYKILYLYGIP